METALSTINVLPSNKEELVRFVKTLKYEILANDKNPLPILVQLKFIEKAIEDILKDEAVVVNGATLRQSEVGVKYLYKDCGDPVWNDLNGQIEALTEKRKEREKFLQNIPYDKGTVDPDTGLFITRPPKSSKTKVIVKL